MGANDTTLAFNVLGRDRGASRVLRKVGREASNTQKALSALGRLDLGGATDMLGGLAKIAAIGGAGASGLAALPSVFATLATVSVGAAAGVSAMALAVSGVSEALKFAAEGKTEKFEEALAKLSPSARSFTREVAGMLPRLQSFRNAVQDAFFANLDDGVMTRVANNLLPTLQRGLGAIAALAGKAARRVADFLTTGKARDTLASLLDGALDTLKQLGRIAMNVGRILAGLMRIDAGSSLLDTIERITGAIADFANSARGQEILAKVMETLAKAGPAVMIGGLLVSVATSLGTALAALFTPAGAVVAAVLTLGAAFALLYRQSQPLREILAMVGAKAKEIFDLFVDKGLPVLKKVAQEALVGLERGLKIVRQAIEDNKPALQDMFAKWKIFAEFMMTKVWPILGPILKAAFIALGTSISMAITAISRLWGAFKSLATIVLTNIKVVLISLANLGAAMGKLPGKAGEMGRGIASAAQTAINKIDGITRAINRIPTNKAVYVNVNYSNAYNSGNLATGPRREHGGPVHKGMPYVVGEKRAELFVPDQNGMIQPRVPAAMQAGRGGWSGGAQQVRVVFDVTGADEDMKRLIRRITRVDGRGNVQLAFGTG